MRKACDLPHHLYGPLVADADRRNNKTQITADKNSHTNLFSSATNRRVNIAAVATATQPLFIIIDVLEYAMKTKKIMQKLTDIPETAVF